MDVSNEFSDGYSGFSTAARFDRPPGKYTLREKRRVKLNELHYFDHPFFGMLVRVSRYEPSRSPTAVETRTYLKMTQTRLRREKRSVHGVIHERRRPKTHIEIHPEPGQDLKIAGAAIRLTFCMPLT